MPLVRSAARGAVSENIRREMSAGRPQRQAVAIALDVARRSKRALGGRIDEPGRYQDGGAPQFGAMSSSDLPGPFLSQPDVAQQPTGGVMSAPDLPMPSLGAGPFGGMPGSSPLAALYGGGFGGFNPFSFYGGGGNGGFGRLHGGGLFGNLGRMQQGPGQPIPPQMGTPPQLPQTGMPDARAFSSNTGVAPPMAGAADVNNPSSIVAPQPTGVPPVAGIPRADGGRARFALGGFGPGGGHPYGARGKPSGLIRSAVPGRTDRIKMAVAPHSYIIPADIVSGMGQGNTEAGGKIFKQMFQSGPYGAAPHTGPYGVPAPKGARIPTRLHGPRPPRFGGSSLADGGEAPDSEVPILSAGGEYVVDPATVARIGGGDMDAGHRRLDHMVKHLRPQFIRHLARLPGPKKD